MNYKKSWLVERKHLLPYLFTNDNLIFTSHWTNSHKSPHISIQELHALFMLKDRSRSLMHRYDRSSLYNSMNVTSQNKHEVYFEIALFHKISPCYSRFRYMTIKNMMYLINHIITQNLYMLTLPKYWHTQQQRRRNILP